MTPLLNFMHSVIPDEAQRENLLNFFASLCQSPGSKIKWMPVLFGPAASGKSAVIAMLAKSLFEDSRVGVVPPVKIKSGFTSWLKDKQLIIFDEIGVAPSPGIYEALLKNEKTLIQVKGAEDQVILNTFALCGMSHPFPYVPTYFYVVRCAPMDKLQSFGIAKVVAWCHENKTEIRQYLMGRDLKGFDLNNPPT
jgi:hypothetical protein